LHDRPVQAVSSGKNGRLYTVTKNLSRNRKLWTSLLALAVVAGAGSYYWNKQKAFEFNASAAAAAKQVSTDLAEVLSRTQPSIDIQAELTGLAIKNITKTVEAAPDNVPAALVLSDSYMRLAQLEGHPLYLSRESTVDALVYLGGAIDRLRQIKSYMREHGIEEVSGETVDDLISESLVDIHLLRAQRLVAEIKVYTNSRSRGLEEIKQLEQDFESVTFDSQGRDHILDYARDLLYFSQANLLSKNFAKAEVFLEKASKQLTRVSAIPMPSKSNKEDETERLKKLSGLAKEQAVENQERRERAADEALKEVRFLKAFRNEQRGYIAFKSGDIVAASRAYQLVKLSDDSADTRMIPLANRINNMQACIALANNETAVGKALLERILSRGETLLEDHPSARRQEDYNKRLSTKRLGLKRQLGCHDPELIVFPLHPVSIEND